MGLIDGDYEGLKDSLLLVRQLFLELLICNQLVIAHFRSERRKLVHLRHAEEVLLLVRVKCEGVTRK